MRVVARRGISADHPSLSGHFPGNPIVPGVVILDEVFEALMAWRGPCAVTAMPAVKFLAPLRPAQEFAIDLSEAVPGRVVFRCTESSRPLATGELEYEVLT